MRRCDCCNLSNGSTLSLLYCFRILSIFMFVVVCWLWCCACCWLRDRVSFTCRHGRFEFSPHLSICHTHEHIPFVATLLCLSHRYYLKQEAWLFLGGSLVVDLFILSSSPWIDCFVVACHIVLCCVVVNTIVLWTDYHWIWQHNLIQHVYYNDYNCSSTHKQCWKQSYLSFNRANCIAENQTRTGSVVILNSILKCSMVLIQLQDSKASHVASLWKGPALLLLAADQHLCLFIR